MMIRPYFADAPMPSGRNAAFDRVTDTSLKGGKKMRLNATLLASTLLAAAVACSSSSPPPTQTIPPDAGLPDAGQPDAGQPDAGPADPVKTGANDMIDEGRQTFRFDTFGDEAFWTSTIHLDQAIATVSPKTALSVGLKVDVDALPQSLKDALAAGTVNLDDAANTRALIGLNAVVGVKGTVDANNNLTSLGVTCALCHSTVDGTSGIGHRLDGWANRDLDVGAIIDLAPDLTAVQTLLGVDRPTLDSVLKSWGPGRFDAEVFLDGKAFKTGGGNASVLIPPAFGLLGVNMHTWTGWGSVTYWNAFVAVLEMHGKGNFFDTRLDDTTTFPVSAANGFGHVQVPLADDQVTAKLGALQFYQLAIKAPTPPAGSFDAAAAARGEALFNGTTAKCSTCHVPPLFTEPGWNMHAPADVGLTATGDDFQSQRSPDKKYRTSPLKGLFSHSKGGFYHDGRFATLADVVAHYNSTGGLGLTADQQTDLVEYLKSL
jgi:hypothetical protein